ncbi:MAG TPA: anti-sigma factor [Dehalococcoidia bacterium]|nr:anti-sigma factor [Dehalococcoidia bacterium]
MECSEARELIDAYALGALDKGEAKALLKHLESCLSCWQELKEAEEARNLLALGAPAAFPGPALKTRVLQEAASAKVKPKPFSALGKALPRATAVAGLAVSLAAVFSLAFFFKSEVDDLNAENDVLQQEVTSASAVLQEQQQMLTLLAEPDLQRTVMTSGTAQPEATGMYFYSKSREWGAISCNKLDRLSPGQTYRVWVVTPTGWVSAGDFRSWRGIGQYTIDFRKLDLRAAPTAIIVTLEPDSRGEVLVARLSQ